MMRGREICRELPSARLRHQQRVQAGDPVVFFLLGKGSKERPGVFIEESAAQRRTARLQRPHLRPHELRRDGAKVPQAPLERRNALALDRNAQGGHSRHARTTHRCGRPRGGVRRVFMLKIHGRIALTVHHMSFAAKRCSSKLSAFTRIPRSTAPCARVPALSASKHGDFRR